MQSTLEKTDTELKTDILAELRYEPLVKTTDIGVLVKDGTVTLNGLATSYSEKWAAVTAAKRVSGVIGLADDIEVRLNSSFRRTDGDIAAAATTQLESYSSATPGAVQVTVRDGWITLEGEQEWWYQKNSAAFAVHSLAGVKGVTNLITIKPALKAFEIEEAIRSAFKRNALLDAYDIEVETSGNKVTLSGNVRNHAERDEADRAAWAAPGVLLVENNIKVTWPWFGE